MNHGQTRSLFIADLHLSPERPRHIHLLCELLEDLTPEQERLYILGDLFEFWLGDDAILPAYQVVIEQLRAATKRGCDIAIMHGNRDFLLGERFLTLTGCRLLDDPCLIELAGRRVLLSHGDALCTDDHEYQRYRAYVRNPDVQREFLAQSVDERQRIAREHRMESHKRSADKQQAIMDVNPQAVIDLMTRYGVETLIHGHTHRPARHRLMLAGQPGLRIVLSDWGKHGHIIRHSGRMNDDFTEQRLGAGSPGTGMGPSATESGDDRQ